MNGIWIRSQNKMSLIFANRLEIMSRNDGKARIVNWVDGVNSYDLLGEYTTETRALDVLNDIYAKIIEIDYARFLGCENELHQTPIYQMPQE
jgi:hypothetical protein